MVACFLGVRPEGDASAPKRRTKATGAGLLGDGDVYDCSNITERRREKDMHSLKDKVSPKRD